MHCRCDVTHFLLKPALAAAQYRGYIRFNRIDTCVMAKGLVMTVEIVRGFFFWCSIINYGLLLLWALPFVFWRDGLYRWWCWWFRVSPEQFDTLNIAGSRSIKLGSYSLTSFLASRSISSNNDAPSA